MSTSKHITLGALALLILFTLGIVTGLVGISYPVRVDNSSLISPIKVVRITDNQIELADGRMISLSSAHDDHEWQGQIVYSKNMVDVEGDPGSPEVWIYGDRKFMLCGTPWAQPIRIPMIPNRIPMNHRQLIAAGEITKKAEQDETRNHH